MRYSIAANNDTTCTVYVDSPNAKLLVSKLPALTEIHVFHNFRNAMPANMTLIFKHPDGRRMYPIACINVQHGIELALYSVDFIRSQIY
jgi:hypothetical protein